MELGYKSTYKKRGIIKMESSKQRSLIGKIYDSTVLSIIPQYAVLSLTAGLLLNSLIYWGTQQIMKNAVHYDLTGRLEEAIPFQKEWIIIYIASYLFWAVCYIMVAKRGKEEWYRFSTADMLSRLVCCFFFLVLPTTNIRPEVNGNGICSFLVRFIYQNDEATNLFPSIHCLCSWLCFLGLRKERKISIVYRFLAFVMAILICLSTVFVKQHYVIDIFGGVIIAQLCYAYTLRSPISLKVMAAFDRLEQVVFYKKQVQDLSL